MQQLKIKETADLYCSLGEVTKNYNHFQKAIEISKGRSAKAYRMLAKNKFLKEEVNDKPFFSLIRFYLKSFNWQNFYLILIILSMKNLLLFLKNHLR
jgi:hypothetical protein